MQKKIKTSNTNAMINLAQLQSQLKNIKNCKINSANLMFRGNTLIGVIQKVSLSLVKMQFEGSYASLFSTEN